MAALSTASFQIFIAVLVLMGLVSIFGLVGTLLFSDVKDGILDNAFSFDTFSSSFIVMLQVRVLHDYHFIRYLAYDSWNLEHVEEENMYSIAIYISN